MTKYLCVTGGKGGTGKSTIATAIAHALANRHRVLLVDADVDCPNDHLLLSMKRDYLEPVTKRIPEFDLERCSKCGMCGQVCRKNAIVSVEGRLPIFFKQQCNGCGACKLICPSDAISWGEKTIGKIYTGRMGDLELLSGELSINEPQSEAIVSRLKELVENAKHDFVIIDTAAGIHCPVIAALEGCNQVLCVTEPTPLGAHDLKLVLKLSKEMGLNTSIILNRSDIGDASLIESLASENKMPITARIPYDKRIMDAYSKGKAIPKEYIDEVLKNL